MEKKKNLFLDLKSLVWEDFKYIETSNFEITCSNIIEKGKRNYLPLIK